MKFMPFILIFLFCSCMEDFSDFENDENAFDRRLAGYWLLDGKMNDVEAGLTSQRTITSLSIDSSGVFLFEQMQMEMNTGKPVVVQKYVGTATVENSELTLTAKRTFLFNSGFEDQYAEWNKTDRVVFDKYSFILQGDSLTLEDMADDILGSKAVYIKIR